MTDTNKLERELKERVKELALLHAATRLLQSSRPPLQVILTELVALLPPAWQHPDICQARISFAGIDARTPFWCESPWKMSTSFGTHDGRDGFIEVIYLQQTRLADEGPFFAEERMLIDSLAELLAAYLERRGATGTETGSEQYQPEDVALLGELPDAIARDQLILHYQPRIDLRSGRTTGVEALVRWQHPVHGLINPDRFVFLAESSQLINALTHWVLAHAFAQWQDWARSGLQLGLSLNLSSRNLSDRTLEAKILELARKAGLPLELLTLEINESTILAEPGRAKRVMEELHARGVQFTMEDFGTGQFTSTWLQDLPISKMKIEKAFVMGFGDAYNAAIVRAAIELAHSHGMQITAEGVENEKTRAQLEKLGCDEAQGYFFSKPLPRNKLLAWLRKSRWGCEPSAQ